MKGLIRCDFSPQGKTGDVEMDVVKDVEACSEKGRLKAKGDCERWDTRRLTVNRNLILNMEPRLESMGKMDTILFQRYEYYLTRVPAMLSEAQLIWFHPEGLNREMVEEPHNSSVASFVLTVMMDSKHREFNNSIPQKQENIVLLDEKPGD